MKYMKSIPLLQESLSRFMHRRYLVDEVVSSALHDFIAALQKYYPQNKAGTVEISSNIPSTTGET